MRLFTIEEQELVSKAKRAQDMESGIFGVDPDIRETANLIVGLCKRYAGLGDRAKLDDSFTEFMEPYIVDAHPRAIQFFELNNFYPDLYRPPVNLGDGILRSTWDDIFHNCRGDYSYYIDMLREEVEFWKENSDDVVLYVAVDKKFFDAAESYGLIPLLEQVIGTLEIRSVEGISDMFGAPFIDDVTLNDHLSRSEIQQ
jgi:hypothetical protein